MPAPYNISLVTGTSNPSELILGLNTLSGGLLGTSMIVSFFFIAWIGLTLNGNGVKDSFAASSFATAIMAMFFWSQLWISGTLVIISFTFVLISILLLSFNR